MEHTALDQGMFWVGALFVFTPIIFAGIVLGVWWRGKKRRMEGNPAPDADHPVS